jgi:hypothetical protein
MRRNFITAAVLTAVLFTPSAFSQGFTPDARRIALGAVGNQSNIASKLIEEQEPYRSIAMPIGLLQVLRNLKVYDPNDPNFDPVRAVENIASPMHFTFDRGAGIAGSNLIRDLVSGRVNRDLNTYRGFVPASDLNAQGLWAPDWGKTIHVAGGADSKFSHGFFVGAGPYVSLGTNLKVDQNLIDILSSSTNVYRPNTTFTIGDLTTGQGAVAITGGYRGRLAVFDSARSGRSKRDGLYIATDYHYLRGLHYESADLALRFDTDQTGQITLLPTTTPLAINRTSAKKGHGFAVDLGTALITHRWNFGFGVNGIGNRIDWDSPEAEQVVLQSLFLGGNFVTTPQPAPAARQRVSLPLQYSGSGGYHADRWSAQTEVSRGLQGWGVRDGVEYRLGPFAVRGGTRYQLGRWHGSTGLGFNLTKKVGIDLAAFQTTSNIERKQKIALALSLRLNRSETE